MVVCCLCIDLTYPKKAAYSTVSEITHRHTFTPCVPAPGVFLPVPGYRCYTGASLGLQTERRHGHCDPCHPCLTLRSACVSQSVSQSVISRSHPALTPPPVLNPAPPLPSPSTYSRVQCILPTGPLRLGSVVVVYNVLVVSKSKVCVRAGTGALSTPAAGRPPGCDRKGKRNSLQRSSLERRTSRCATC